MHISKDLDWLQEYVDSIQYMLPKVKQVKKISSKRVSENRKQQVVGLITYYDKKSFRICLYTNYKSKIDDKVKKYSTIDILCTLAHELAHLEHWLHTPEHKQLECAILGLFMTKLKQDGYVSEEDETKNGSFY